MKQLQPAILAARSRTNRHIGVSVKNGEFTVVEVTVKAKGFSDVKKLSELMDMQKTVKFLESLQ